MEEDYLRLDCRIKRYNHIKPASFIIDAARETPAAAVFDRHTYESLDHRKGQGPRPLKTHAYNFSYIEGEGGEVLVRERASNAREAASFAQVILEAARPIPRQQYLDELDRVIWPAYAKEERDMHGWQSRSRMMQKRIEEALPEQSMMRMRLLADRSVSCSLVQELSPAGPSGAEDRKDLVKEMVRLMGQMDRDDLRSLYNYALMLLRG